MAIFTQDPDAILFQLHESSPSEEIYAKYSRLKSENNFDKLSKYIHSIPKGVISRYNLVIPELPETVPDYFQDDVLSKNKRGLITINALERNKPLFFHRHSYFETLYVIEGIFSHTLHGKTERLSSGDCITISPGVEHALSVPETAIVIAIRYQTEAAYKLFGNALFDFGDLITRFFINNDATHINSSSLFFHSDKNDTLKRIILSMYSESVSTGNESSLYALVAFFWSHAAQNCSETLSSQSNSSKTDMQINIILYYIRDHYNDGTLSELSSILHYTPEFSSRIIKKLTGSTFIALRAQARITASTDLLITTSKTLQEISEEIGYEYQESFIRSFRKIYHISPTEYRKIHQT